MGYLLLAIASSATIAMIMRISAGKVKAGISMLAVNYITCLLLSAIYADFQVLPLQDPGFPTAVAMGAINGMLYLAGSHIPTLLGIKLDMSATPLLQMLPYVVTIIVLIVTSIGKGRENQPPAALGLPYFREER